MAVVIPITQNTVSNVDMSGDRDSSPANGMRKKRMLTPAIDSTVADSTVPAILAGGDTSRRSSSWPTANMTMAPRATPSGIVLASNTAVKSALRHATPRPTRKPSRMAAPPSSAVGRSCTRRSSGAWTAPMLKDSRRNRGVVVRVTSAEATTTGRNCHR